MIKNIVTFIVLFGFIGNISVPVFAQSKKSSAKKSGSSSAKSSSSKKASSARAASRSSSKSSRASSARSVSSTRSLSRLSSSATVSSSTLNCLASFVDCMDAQIDTTISNYQYLADDPAIQAMQETADPLRCIYYNASKVEGLFSSGAGTKYCSADLVSSRKDTVIDAKGKSVKQSNFNDFNICSNQKDVNDLYLSYNYYCDLDSSNVGVAGMPINKCNLKKSSGNDKNAVFATQDSYAYYNEANRRADAGELKIINFEQTNLFKNKIEPLGLENWNQMSLTSDASCGYVDASGNKCNAGAEGCVKMCTNSVSDLMNDLGLKSTGTEIFSINVVPPIGAGNFDPGSQYEKAKNICFGNATFKLAGKTASENEKTVQSAISYLSTNCSDPKMRTDMERYYIAGTTVKICDDGYSYNSSTDMCVNQTDKDDTMTPYTSEDFEAGNTDLEQTDFLSAKKSCDLYEQTLISTRNKAYADFDTQLKNYIDDEVAKLIKNKTKSLTTIANSLSSLQETDANITISNMEREANLKTSKADAEIAIMNAETNLLTKQLESSKTTISVRNELKSLVSENYSKQINSACLYMADNLISKLTTDNSSLSKLVNLSVKANVDGDIRGVSAISESDSNVLSDAEYAALDKNKYQEFFCNELDGFNLSEKIAKRVDFGSCSSISLVSSGSIPMGIYKIVLSGAGGGGGGGNAKQKGGNGGSGAKLEQVILLSKAENYKLSIGIGGSGGGGNKLRKSASDGRDGGDTTFTIMGTTYKADGGKGGEGASGRSNGDAGANGGNGLGSSGGSRGSDTRFSSGDKGTDGSAAIYCVSSVK